MANEIELVGWAKSLFTLTDQTEARFQKAPGQVAALKLFLPEVPCVANSSRKIPTMSQPPTLLTRVRAASINQ